MLHTLWGRDFSVAVFASGRKLVRSRGRLARRLLDGISHFCSVHCPKTTSRSRVLGEAPIKVIPWRLPRFVASLLVNPLAEICASAKDVRFSLVSVTAPRRVPNPRYRSDPSLDIGAPSNPHEAPQPSRISPWTSSRLGTVIFHTDKQSIQLAKINSQEMAGHRSRLCLVFIGNLALCDEFPAGAFQRRGRCERPGSGRVIASLRLTASMKLPTLRIVCGNWIPGSHRPFDVRWIWEQ